MPPDEQRERMRPMREMVREHNVYRWAGSMLLDAARLRKRIVAPGAAQTGAAGSASLPSIPRRVAPAWNRA